MSDQEAAPTVREALESSIAQHSEPAPEPVEQPTAQPEAAPAESAPEPKKGAGRTVGRARDEHGKLLPGKAVRPAQEPAAEPQKPVDPTSTIEAQTAPAVAPIPRPSSWKKEMWPLWDKLNTGAPLTAQEARQVAEYNAQRETQFATGVSTYKSIADNAKPLLEAVAPFQADIERYGANAPQLVHSLLTAHRNLALGSPQQKLQLLNKLAGDYGIPIQALYDQSAQQQYLMTPHVPQAMPAAPEVPLEQKFEQFLAQREVKQTVEQMAKDTEKYPFFNYVRSDMSQLLETGEATDLDDAYYKSLDLPQHAMLAPLMQQQQTAAIQQQVIANKGKVAAVARGNAVSPRSATPASQAVPDKPTSVRESLRAAIAQHVGGGRV